MTEEEAATTKAWLRGTRSANTIMRRLWTGAMLPSIRLKEASGSVDDQLDAQSMRLNFEHMLDNLDDLANGRPVRWPEDES